MRVEGVVPQPHKGAVPQNQIPAHTLDVECILVGGKQHFRVVRWHDAHPLDRHVPVVARGNADGAGTAADSHVRNGQPPDAHDIEQRRGIGRRGKAQADAVADRTVPTGKGIRPVRKAHQIFGRRFAQIPLVAGNILLAEQVDAVDILSARRRVACQGTDKRPLTVKSGNLTRQRRRFPVADGQPPDGNILTVRQSKHIGKHIIRLHLIAGIIVAGIDKLCVLPHQRNLPLPEHPDSAHQPIRRDEKAAGRQTDDCTGCRIGYQAVDFLQILRGGGHIIRHKPLGVHDLGGVLPRRSCFTVGSGVGSGHPVL